MLQASYRNGADGTWSRPMALSDGRPTTTDLLLSFSGAAAVVYPNGSAAVFWSIDHQILGRELGKAK